MQPEKAKALALHTMDVIRQLDTVRAVKDIRPIFDDWCAWAEREGVAPQIRKHMADKCKELHIEIEASKVATLTARSRAMQGEQQ